MAILNATDVVVKINTDHTASGAPSDVLLHCTSASLSVSRDLRDSTTKSSLGWQTNLPGLKSWEISGDGFADFSGTNDIKDLIDEMILDSNPEVKVSFGTSSGIYSGTAIISSASIDAGVEENATYSLTLTGTGTLVYSS